MASRRPVVLLGVLVLSACGAPDCGRVTPWAATASLAADDPSAATGGLLLAAAPAGAQPSLPPESGCGPARGRPIPGLMGFGMTPDGSSNSAALRQGPGAAGTKGDTSPQFGQFWPGGTLSEGFLLLVEGAVAWVRYDPTAIRGGGERRSPLVRWNNLTATFGVGNDIRIGDNLRPRPTVLGSLGHAVSDVALAGRLRRDRLGIESPCLGDRKVFAHGLGGSLTRACLDCRPGQEIDAQLRYSPLRIAASDSGFAAARGSLTAATLGLWGRRLADGVGSHRPADRLGGGRRGPALPRAAAGQARLQPVGDARRGIEFEIGRREIGLACVNATRLRVVGRCFLADRRITGASIGVGLSV